MESLLVLILISAWGREIAACEKTMDDTRRMLRGVIGFMKGAPVASQNTGCMRFLLP
jgi:hypothetical protein